MPQCCIRCILSCLLLDNRIRNIITTIKTQTSEALLQKMCEVAILDQNTAIVAVVIHQQQQIHLGFHQAHNTDACLSTSNNIALKLACNNSQILLYQTLTCCGENTQRSPLFYNIPSQFLHSDLYEILSPGKPAFTVGLNTESDRN